MSVVLRFDARIVECKCLWVAKVDERERLTGRKTFENANEKIYRRLGRAILGEFRVCFGRISCFWD